MKRKIVIIGAGHVGSHAAFTLASQGLCEEIVLIDTNIAKAMAQALDISDAMVYLQQNVKVYAGDYKDVKNACIVVISAGPLPDMNKGQTRMDTLRQSVEVIKDIVPKIKTVGYDGIVINITNPADVITQLVQHMLDIPHKRVLSTSTSLDSARLRRAIANELNIDPKSITAYSLGEHGESQMVPWSTVAVGGKPLLQLMEEQPQIYGRLNLQKLGELGKRGGWTILEGKGSTEFGIASTIAEVVRAILGNERKILPVSTMLNGEYKNSEVYASVPAILGENGVEEIIELTMTPYEQAEFDVSCKTMRENFKLSLTF